MGRKKASKQDVLRAIARLASQARLNAADASTRRRYAEQRAWETVVLLLTEQATRIHLQGVEVQVPLF